MAGQNGEGRHWGDNGVSTYRYDGKGNKIATITCDCAVPLGGKAASLPVQAIHDVYSHGESCPVFVHFIGRIDSNE